jgi:hypothetical protein
MISIPHLRTQLRPLEAAFPSGLGPHSPPVIRPRRLSDSFRFTMKASNGASHALCLPAFEPVAKLTGQQNRLAEFSHNASERSKRFDAIRAKPYPRCAQEADGVSRCVAFALGLNGGLVREADGTEDAEP